ncbi:MAG: asparagine synthase (glutamine-hydrolyzing) [Bacteroidetes bacterium]|nr:asparagine synthase (glutamine-hydrolyzing) [Bacteroidota bacterium]
MSAIAGFFSQYNHIPESDLHAMALALKHRGQHGEHFFHETPAGIAHCNLTIEGNFLPEIQQPVHSACGRYVLAFDGDICNADELRREYALSTQPMAEVEIILQLIVQQGIRVCSQFSGSFAIALYDRFEKKLTLLRDCLGAKPLYYFWDGTTCVFASELKALQKVAYVKSHTTINYAAVNYFLHSGYVGGDYSIYTNIYKVESGTSIEIRENCLQKNRFKQLNDSIQAETITDFAQARETLRDLVEAAVRTRMKNNCKYASFLSGGIDSSLVTAIMQRNSSARIQTFTVDFPDSPHNESSYAQKIASYLGTEHHTIQCTKNDAARILPTLLDIYDEPYADTSALPTLLVSQAAKQSAPVAFLGDGGDELFLGYGAYTWAQRLQNPHLVRWRKPLSAVLQLTNDSYRRGAKVLNFPNKDLLPSHIYSQEQGFFSRPEIAKLMAQPEFLQAFEQIQYQNGLARTLSPAENQALFDLHYALQEELITKVDRASMHYGLKTFAPLLDDSIIEFALNVDERLKLHNGEKKYLLKQVLYDYVPAELYNRPKWGFSIPLQSWLAGDLSFLLDEWLNPQMLKKHGVVNPKVVERYVYLFRKKNHAHLYNRLWALVVLHQFLEKDIFER